ncbi:MAG TPA: hypothetical protein ENJ28_00725 [Gammaproteobacteria bacterium]|nr:hypothetical protein [Gammaproteobacteria bacterium]
MFSKLKLFVKLMCGYAIALLSLVCRKREGIVFIGMSSNSHFIDNCKYLYLYMHENGHAVVWVTQSQSVFDELRGRDLPVRLLNNRNDFNYLLGVKVLVVDTISWVGDYKYFYLYGAKKIQLWHGIGLKRIELNAPEIVQMTSLYERLCGRFARYDFIASPSKFSTENYLQPSFELPMKCFIHSGYPRNDIFFEGLKNSDIGVDSDVEARVIKKKNKGGNIILYAPTFRDSARAPIGQDEITMLNQFAQAKNIYFIFKFHPFVNFDLDKLDVGFSNIDLYPAKNDIYPLFKYVDLMITDYSSIYIDFLLLDRPVLFYCYDYSEYLAQDRGMVFDYDEMTPGDKAYNFKELIEKISSNLTTDTHEHSRKKIRDLIFEHRDHLSSYRITKYLLNLKLI